jgi:hypothetical protein
MAEFERVTEAELVAGLGAERLADVSAFCGCGAQWHGRYVALAADVIAAHRGRSGRPVTASRRPERDDVDRCQTLTHDEFARVFRCLCDACCRERATQPKRRRVRR